MRKKSAALKSEWSRPNDELRQRILATVEAMGVLNMTDMARPKDVAALCLVILNKTQALAELDLLRKADAYFSPHSMTKYRYQLRIKPTRMEPMITGMLKDNKSVCSVKEFRA
ncbi:hypothetical protein M885DRAFT_570734, partial [Pelagophyceae sp. CCMP2097]